MLKYWKHLAAAFVACLVLVLLAQPAEAVGGQQGAFTYELKGNGTAVITKFDWSKHSGGDVYVPRSIDGYTVTEIGEYAFGTPGISLPHASYNSRKAQLKGEKVVVILPDTITTIGNFAFCQTNITGCMIPASVRQIGTGAFCGCVNIKQFTVASENKTYATIDGILYNKSSKELVAFPLSYGTSHVTIPEGIKSIGEYAFACLGIRFNGHGSLSYTISLPSTLTTVKDYGFYYAGDKSYNDTLRGYLSSIQEIGRFAFLGSGIHFLEPLAPEVIGAYAFSEYKDVRFNWDFPVSFHNVKEIGAGAFSNIDIDTSGSRSNETLTLDLSDAQITRIAPYTFSGIDLTARKLEIVLPSTVTEIGNSAFEGCKVDKLSIIIPNKVTTIGDGAFKLIYFLDLRFASGSELTHIGSEAFYNTSFANKEIELPEGLVTIGERAFHEGTPELYKSNLSTLIVPSTVTSIGEDVVYRANVSLKVVPDSYAEFWALENGYPIVSEDDTSWLFE